MTQWQSADELALAVAVAAALLMLSLPLIPLARDGWSRLRVWRRT